MGNTGSKREKPSDANIKKKPETNVSTPPYSTNSNTNSTTTSNNSGNTASNTSPSITNKPNINSNSTTVVASSANNSTSGNNVSSTNTGSKPDTSKNSNTKSTESDKTKRLDDFYEKYKDQEDPNVIGPDGIIKLCEDLGVDPEDVVILVLAWRLNAKKMGYFTKKEFIEGLSKFGVDSLQKLKSHLPQLNKDLDDPNNFKDIYRFAFVYAKENEQTKIIDLESACGMLSLVIGTRYPHTEKLKEFLMSQKSYKVLNMDQWLSILEFSKVISADCSNYDFEGAWPVILDEYSTFVKNSLKK